MRIEPSPVIVVFLDDSGEPNEPYVTLAGYMGTRNEWARFEEEASKYLDAHGIEYLHTVDMHRMRGQFDGWTREQVREFATGLFLILGKYIPVGLAFSVFKQVFDAKRVDLKREGAATTFCLKGLITRMINQPGFDKAFELDGVDISIVLEKGNRHEDAMLQEFARISALDGRFKAIEAADKKAYIALQVSDFLAYFTRRLLCRDKAHPRYADEEKFFDDIIKGVAVHNRFVATDFHAEEPREGDQ